MDLSAGEKQSSADDDSLSGFAFLCVCVGLLLDGKKEVIKKQNKPFFLFVRERRLGVGREDAVQGKGDGRGHHHQEVTARVIMCVCNCMWAIGQLQHTTYLRHQSARGNKRSPSVKENKVLISH
jgi:hypothetical protein